MIYYFLVNRAQGLLIGILGYLRNGALLGVEHHVLAWHRGARGLTN